ncbi:MAG: hypothetical protein WCI11_11405 [Candidatus Methylumidiphilus sp.]
MASGTASERNLFHAGRESHFRGTQGTSIIGGDGVDKRISTLAMALQMNARSAPMLLN